MLGKFFCLLFSFALSFQGMCMTLLVTDPWVGDHSSFTLAEACENFCAFMSRKPNLEYSIVAVRACGSKAEDRHYDVTALIKKRSASHFSKVYSFKLTKERDVKCVGKSEVKEELALHPPCSIDDLLSIFPAVGLRMPFVQGISYDKRASGCYCWLVYEYGRDFTFGNDDVEMLKGVLAGGVPVSESTRKEWVKRFLYNNDDFCRRKGILKNQYVGMSESQLRQKLDAKARVYSPLDVYALPAEGLRINQDMWVEGWDGKSELREFTYCSETHNIFIWKVKREDGEWVVFKDMSVPLSF